MGRAARAFSAAKKPKHAPKGVAEGGQFIGPSSILHGIIRLLQQQTNGDRPSHSMPQPTVRRVAPGGSVVMRRRRHAGSPVISKAPRRRGGGSSAPSVGDSPAARLIRGEQPVSTAVPAPRRPADRFPGVGPRVASRGNPPNVADVRARLLAARPGQRLALLDGLNLNTTQARNLARDLGVRGAGRLSRDKAIGRIVRYFEPPAGFDRARAAALLRPLDPNAGVPVAEAVARAQAILRGARSPAPAAPAGPRFEVRPSGFSFGVWRIEPDGSESRVSTHSSQSLAITRASRLTGGGSGRISPTLTTRGAPSVSRPARRSPRTASAPSPSQQAGMVPASASSRDGLDEMTDHSLRGLAREYGLANPSTRDRASLLAGLRAKHALSPAMGQAAHARASATGRPVSRRPSPGLQIALALQTWSNGEGPDDPLAGFTREQLRAEARARSITLPRGATEAVIKEALLEHTRTHFRGRQRSLPGLMPVGDFITNTDQHAQMAAARAVFEGDFGGMRTVVDSAGSSVWSPGSTSVTGQVLDANGRNVGSFHRRYTVERGRIVAHHEFLSINGQVQGSGFSNAFNGHLIRWYRKSGVKEVRVHADIDVGGYAWARLGYDFANQRSANEIMARLQRTVAGAEAVGRIGPRRRADHTAQLDAARALLVRASGRTIRDPGYPTAFEISQLGRWDGATTTDMWIGKLALLGADWEGVMVL